MRLEITRLQCAIPLNAVEWDRLERLDYLDVVNPTQVKAGALDSTAEYNGHFGRNVFFTVNSKVEGEQVLTALTTCCIPSPADHRRLLGFSPPSVLGGYFVSRKCRSKILERRNTTVID